MKAGLAGPEAAGDALVFGRTEIARHFRTAGMLLRPRDAKVELIPRFPCEAILRSFCTLLHTRRTDGRGPELRMEQAP